MNKKGFAVTGIIYTLMVLFIILVISLLAMFNDRKKILDELKNKVEKKVNQPTVINDFTFFYNPNTEFEEYDIKLKGYYNIITNTSSSQVSAKYYFKEGEKLYIKIGTNDNEIYIEDNENKILLMNNKDYYNNTYDNRIFISKEESNNLQSEPFVIISYDNNTKVNSDLNKVRYIKDCLYSNSSNEENEWSEIMAIINGENRLLNASVYENNDANIPSLIVDGDIETSTNSLISSENKTCVSFDLGRNYNLDYIKTWHNYSDNRIYYERNLSVSIDGINFKTIDNYEQKETKNGLIVSAYEPKRTFKLNDKYYSVKELDGATWLRIFHHNSNNGTTLWDAKSQVLKTGGYSMPYKISGLVYLEQFKGINNKYELLLEYPDIDDTKYNRWLQTSDFTKENTVKGFSNLKTSFTSSENEFEGLKLDGINSIISGKNEYYTIGALRDNVLGANNVITGTVDLWVKIDDYIKEVKE